MSPGVEVAVLDGDGLAAEIDALASLLHACVHEGASVGFVLPFAEAEAAGFWREAVLPPLRAGRRRVIVAREGGQIVGTVQLLHDMPPNQPHRGEVAKLLVHPAARHRGIATALMAAVEAEARALGRSLLTLDTRSGDPAETLCRRLGWNVVGSLPGWCRDTASDRLDATTFMWKDL